VNEERKKTHDKKNLCFCFFWFSHFPFSTIPHSFLWDILLKIKTLFKKK